MNTTTRTLIYLGSAAFLAIVAAVVSMSPSSDELAGFSDVGTPVFPDFEDPSEAETLEVVAWDADAKTSQTFGVKKTNDGLWVITSHNDYPAEAAERLARTAASLIGIERSALQSRNKDDWAKFGVLDPSAENAGEVKTAAASEDDSDDPAAASDPDLTKNEYGTRITLRDSSSNALVDLIVGNDVADRDGYRYVREPDNETTYVSKIDVDLSAKFADWIEPDLLKVQQNKIVKVKVDGYSVDEARGVIVKGDVVEFEKEDLKASGSWTIGDLNEETEEFDESPVTTITSNLQGLKIVGVRKKRPGINADLTVDPSVGKNPLAMMQIQAELQQQGFYIVGDKDGNSRLASNEGELIAGTDEGVLYTLYFGEVARGSDRDIEVGLKSTATDEAAEPTDEEKTDAADETANADDQKKPAEDDSETRTEDTSDSEETTEEVEEEEEESGSRRYVLIKVEFDESLLGPKPEPPTEPTKPEILNQPETPATEKKPADDAQNSEAPKEDTATESTSDDVKDAPAQENSESSAETDESSECDPQDESTPEADVSETPAAPATPDEPAAGSDATDSPAAQEKAQKSSNDKSAAAADETNSEKEGLESPETETDPSDEKPAEPEKSPRQLAQEAYDKAMGEYEGQKTAYESDLKAYEKKIEDGKKSVSTLATRFGGWYYVITANSFEKFRISRSDVVSKKEVKEEDTTPEGTDAEGTDAANSESDK